MLRVDALRFGTRLTWERVLVQFGQRSKVADEVKAEAAAGVSARL